MPGTRTSILSLLTVLATGLLHSAQPEYLPLQAGNSWMYVGLPGTVGAEVAGTEAVDGRNYLQVNLLGRDYLLRAAGDNTLYSYDRGSASESVWLRFGAAEAEPFTTSIDPCTSTAFIVSKAEKFEGPLGEFNNILHIRFELSCADAGLTDAWFLPYIGLIRYSYTTIAGPRTLDLVYSKTGLTEVSTGLVSTRLSSSAPVYEPGGMLSARLSVSNTAGKPLQLEFKDSQRVDLEVRNQAGDQVALLSSTQLFVQVTGTVLVGPGERSWTMTLPLGPLSPGKYVAEGWVTASNAPERAYSASVGFEVTAKK